MCLSTTSGDLPNQGKMRLSGKGADRRSGGGTVEVSRSVSSKGREWSTTTCT